MDTAERYRHFASREVRGHSPGYEELAHGVAGAPDLIALVDGLPPERRQPNLLLGAVRFLGGPVDGFAAFRDWTTGHWPEVGHVMLRRHTQTNEPRRCATLLPLLAPLPKPLALIEVGASAGLCLYPDRYAYRYDNGHTLRPAVGLADGTADSVVTLTCEASGPVPLPERLPEVVWRAGIDINPLDVRDAEDMQWLESLVWPEQKDRRQRLRGAVAVARSEPPHLVRGDLNRTIRDLVAEAPSGATPVVFHSAVLAYLPPEERESFAATMRELPCRWISNEAVGVLPSVAGRLGRAAPEGRTVFALALDEQPVAFTGPHGQFVEWFSDPE